jgi:hypothetical protein
MEKLLNGGCPKHTYINKNGKRQLAHLLIECHEFIQLSQALKEKMQAKAANPASSGLNLIYADTPWKMNVQLANLLPSKTSFHDIVPQKPIYPLGSIHLDVIFSTHENFRKEKIEFVVIDWPSQYHAILRNLVFARFMAVPHYAYLKMRMLDNQGSLTISGSFARSENCDVDFNNLS